MTVSLFKKALTLLITVLYFTTQVALGSAVESNIWADRKKALEQQNSSDGNIQLASLPVQFNNPQSILKQMPVVGGALPTLPKWSDSNKKFSLKLPKEFQTLIDSIPLVYSSIQDVYDSGNEKTAPVVLIQDIHMNSEAQTNIASVLQELIDQRQVGLVGVEGAFSPFDFSRFRAFPDKQITKEVTEAFLNKNLLAAPSFVGITSEVEPALFVGVDDPEHYKANVDAYLSTVRLKPKTLAQLKTVERNLLEEKKKVFSPELRSFDEMRTAYHKGEMGLGEYIKKLNASVGAGRWLARTADSPSEDGTTSFGRASGSPLRLQLQIETFLAAYEMESTLDFKKVDEERRTVIENLTKVLKKGELSDLLAQSLAYRLGRLSFGTYYQNLKTLCEAKGISLRRTPAFDGYIRYVLLSDGIKGDQLFASVAQLEENILSDLAQTPEEKDLAALSEHVTLTEKLIDFSLTPTEWQKYSRRGEPLARPKNVVPSSEGEPAVRASQRLAPTITLKPFESFYDQADIRSHKMVENLLKAKVINESRILICGGFHTPQIAALLKGQKISYVVVSPKVTKIEEGSGTSYLSVFSREKTPLDKLFAGEKLFVNPTALNIGHQTLALKIMGALALAGGVAIGSMKLIDNGWVQVGVIAGVAIFAGFVARKGFKPTTDPFPTIREGKPDEAVLYMENPSAFAWMHTLTSRFLKPMLPMLIVSILLLSTGFSFGYEIPLGEIPYPYIEPSFLSVLATSLNNPIVLSFGLILVLNIALVAWRYLHPSRKSPIDWKEFSKHVLWVPLFENLALILLSIVFQHLLSPLFMSEFFYAFVSTFHLNIEFFAPINPLIAYSLAGATFVIAHLLYTRWKKGIWELRPILVQSGLTLCLNMVFLQMPLKAVSIPMALLIHGPSWNLFIINLRKVFSINTPWLPLASIPAAGDENFSDKKAGQLKISDIKVGGIYEHQQEGPIYVYSIQGRAVQYISLDGVPHTEKLGLLKLPNLCAFVDIDEVIQKRSTRKSQEELLSRFHFIRNSLHQSDDPSAFNSNRDFLTTGQLKSIQGYLMAVERIIGLMKGERPGIWNLDDHPGLLFALLCAERIRSGPSTTSMAALAFFCANNANKKRKKGNWDIDNLPTACLQLIHRVASNRGNYYPANLIQNSDLNQFLFHSGLKSPQAEFDPLLYKKLKAELQNTDHSPLTTANLDAVISIIKEATSHFSYRKPQAAVEKENFESLRNVTDQVIKFISQSESQTIAAEHFTIKILMRGRPQWTIPSSWDMLMKTIRNRGLVITKFPLFDHPRSIEIVLGDRSSLPGPMPQSVLVEQLERQYQLLLSGHHFPSSDQRQRMASEISEQINSLIRPFLNTSDPSLPSFRISSEIEAFERDTSKSNRKYVGSIAVRMNVRNLLVLPKVLPRALNELNIPEATRQEIIGLYWTLGHFVSTTGTEEIEDSSPISPDKPSTTSTKLFTHASSIFMAFLVLSHTVGITISPLVGLIAVFWLVLSIFTNVRRPLLNALLLSIVLISLLVLPAGTPTQQIDVVAGNLIVKKNQVQNPNLVAETDKEISRRLLVGEEKFPFSQLIEWMDHKDNSIFRRAMLQLVIEYKTTGKEALISYIRNHKDNKRRIEAFELLFLRDNNPSTMALSLELLQDQDKDLKKWGERYLFRNPGDFSFFFEHLKDNVPGRRSLMAQFLSVAARHNDIKDEQLISKLSDADINVRWGAAEALFYIYLKSFKVEESEQRVKEPLVNFLKTELSRPNFRLEPNAIQNLSTNLFYRFEGLIEGGFTFEGVVKIYGRSAFLNSTKDLDMANQFSIAKTVEELARRNNVDLSDEAIDSLTGFVLQIREDFSKKTILGNQSTVYGISHWDADFPPERLINIAMVSGFRKKMTCFNGALAKGKIKKAISESRFNAHSNLFLLDGHGGQNHFWLRGGMVGQETSTDFADPNGISYVELSDWLIHRAQSLKGDNKGRLSDMIFIVSACYSEDVIRQALEQIWKKLGEAQTKGEIKDFPTFVVTAGRNEQNYIGIIYNELSLLIQKNNHKFDGKVLFEVNKETTRWQPTQIVIPISPQQSRQLGELLKKLPRKATKEIKKIPLGLEYLDIDAGYGPESPKLLPSGIPVLQTNLGKPESSSQRDEPSKSLVQNILGSVINSEGSKEGSFGKGLLFGETGKPWLDNGVIPLTEEMLFTYLPLLSGQLWVYIGLRILFVILHAVIRTNGPPKSWKEVPKFLIENLTIPLILSAAVTALILSSSGFDLPTLTHADKLMISGEAGAFHIFANAVVQPILYVFFLGVLKFRKAVIGQRKNKSKKDILGSWTGTSLTKFFKSMGVMKEIKSKLETVLSEENWSINATKKRLGLSRQKVDALIKEYDLKRPIRSSQQILTVFRKRGWNIGKAKSELDIQPNENLVDYFGNAGVAKEVKERLEAVYFEMRGSINSVAKKIGLNRNPTRKLLDAYGIGTKNLPPAEIKRIIRKHKWNLGNARTELGIRHGDSMGDFFKATGVAAFVKKPVTQRLKKENWVVSVVSPQFGLHPRDLTNIIAALAIKQPKISPDAALKILEGKKWDVEIAGPLLGLRYKENYSKFFSRLGVEPQARKKVAEVLDANNWDVGTAATRLGMSRVGLNRTIEAYGLKRKMLEPSQILSILEKKEWNLGLAKDELGLKNTEGLIEFFHESGVENNVEEKFSEVINDCKGSILQAAEILGVSYPTMSNFISYYGLDFEASAHNAQVVEKLNLTEAVAILGEDPLRLLQYIRLYHPELSTEKTNQLTQTAIQGLSSDWPEAEEKHESYEINLPQPSITNPSQLRTATSDHSVLISGRVDPSVRFIQVGGAYTKKIRVRQDGTFSGAIPLPKTGEKNEFYVYSINEKEERKSSSVTVRVLQTGDKEDAEAAFLRLIAAREDVLASIQKDPARYQFLLRSVELSLLKHFTYNEQDGLNYIEKKIQEEKSSTQKKILQAVLYKFKGIVQRKFPIRKGERLYFFQKYTIAEVQTMFKSGASAYIIANEQGLGKTITAMVIINGYDALVLTPNAVVSTWLEEEERFLAEPRLFSLEGTYRERERQLKGGGNKQVVTNIEFTQGMTGKRAQDLSRPKGVLVVDESDYLGNTGSQQTIGTNQIAAMKRLFLTATPFRRDSQINNLMKALYPNDPRFKSAKAFSRVFPASNVQATNALFFLMQQNMIRIRKQDVFENYDRHRPLSKQSDRLPKKVEMPAKAGQFYLTMEQCKSILELFTDYEAWCRKHRGKETDEDRRFHKYKEGFFSKREALRQIMNDPTYIGRSEIESPKHLMMDKIVNKELGPPKKLGRKMIVFARYRWQVEQYMKRYAAYGARGYWGGLKQDRNGYRIDDAGHVLYYQVDSFGNFILNKQGRPIESTKTAGQPIRALDYQRICFQNDPECRILVLTYGSGGVGVTLTGADVVVDDDLANSYRDQYQSDDRAHRIDNKRKKYMVRYYRLQALYPKKFLDSLPEKMRRTYFDAGTYDQVQSISLKRQSLRFHRIMDGVGDEEELNQVRERIFKDRMPFLFQRGNGTEMELDSDISPQESKQIKIGKGLLFGETGKPRLDNGVIPVVEEILFTYLPLLSGQLWVYIGLRILFVILHAFIRTNGPPKSWKEVPKFLIENLTVPLILSAAVTSIILSSHGFDLSTLTQTEKWVTTAKASGLHIAANAVLQPILYVFFLGVLNFRKAAIPSRSSSTLIAKKLRDLGLSRETKSRVREIAKENPDFKNYLLENGRDSGFEVLRLLSQHFYIYKGEWAGVKNPPVKQGDEVVLSFVYSFFMESKAGVNGARAFARLYRGKLASTRGEFAESLMKHNGRRPNLTAILPGHLKKLKAIWAAARSNGLEFDQFMGFYEDHPELLDSELFTSEYMTLLKTLDRTWVKERKSGANAILKFFLSICSNTSDLSKTVEWFKQNKQVFFDIHAEALKEISITVDDKNTIPSSGDVLSELASLENHSVAIVFIRLIDKFSKTSSLRADQLKNILKAEKEKKGLSHLSGGTIYLVESWMDYMAKVKPTEEISDTILRAFKFLIQSGHDESIIKNLLDPQNPDGDRGHYVELFTAQNIELFERIRTKFGNKALHSFLTLLSPNFGSGRIFLPYATAAFFDKQFFETFETNLQIILGPDFVRIFSEDPSLPLIRLVSVNEWKDKGRMTPENLQDMLNQLSRWLSNDYLQQIIRNHDYQTLWEWCELILHLETNDRASELESQMQQLHKLGLTSPEKAQYLSALAKSPMLFRYPFFEQPVEHLDNWARSPAMVSKLGLVYDKFFSAHMGRENAEEFLNLIWQIGTRSIVNDFEILNDGLSSFKKYPYSNEKLFDTALSAFSQVCNKLETARMKENFLKSQGRFLKQLGQLLTFGSSIPDQGELKNFREKILSSVEELLILNSTDQKASFEQAKTLYRDVTTQMIEKMIGKKLEEKKLVHLQNVMPMVIRIVILYYLLGARKAEEDTDKLQAELKTQLSSYVDSLDESQIRQAILDVPENKLEIERLITAGYSPQLFTKGISFTTQALPVGDDEIKERITETMIQLADEFIDIAKRINYPGPAQAFSSLEEIELYAKNLLGSGKEVPNSVRERITNEILPNLTALAEKAKKGNEVVVAEKVRVVIKKRFLMEASAGAGAWAGCFQISGDHREMPPKHALEANAFMATIFDASGEKMLANAVLALSDNGVIVYGSYSSRPQLNFDRVWLEAWEELSLMSPGVIMTKVGEESNMKVSAGWLEAKRQKRAQMVHPEKLKPIKRKTVWPAIYVDFGGENEKGHIEVPLGPETYLIHRSQHPDRVSINDETEEMAVPNVESESSDEEKPAQQDPAVLRKELVGKLFIPALKHLNFGPLLNFLKESGFAVGIGSMLTYLKPRTAGLNIDEPSKSLVQNILESVINSEKSKEGGFGKALIFKTGKPWLDNGVIPLGEEILFTYLPTLTGSIWVFAGARIIFILLHAVTRSQGPPSLREFLLNFTSWTRFKNLFAPWSEIKTRFSFTPASRKFLARKMLAPLIISLLVGALIPAFGFDLSHMTQPEALRFLSLASLLHMGMNLLASYRRPKRKQDLFTNTNTTAILELGPTRALKDLAIVVGNLSGPDPEIRDAAQKTLSDIEQFIFAYWPRQAEDLILAEYKEILIELVKKLGDSNAKQRLFVEKAIFSCTNQLNRLLSEKKANDLIQEVYLSQTETLLDKLRVNYFSFDTDENQIRIQLIQGLRVCISALQKTDQERIRRILPSLIANWGCDPVSKPPVVKTVISDERNDLLYAAQQGVEEAEKVIRKLWRAESKELIAAAYLDALPHLNRKGGIENRPSNLREINLTGFLGEEELEPMPNIGGGYAVRKIHELLPSEEAAYRILAKETITSVQEQLGLEGPDKKLADEIKIRFAGVRSAETLAAALSSLLTRIIGENPERLNVFVASVASFPEMIEAIAAFCQQQGSTSVRAVVEETLLFPAYIQTKKRKAIFGALIRNFNPSLNDQAALLTQRLFGFNAATESQMALTFLNGVSACQLALHGSAHFVEIILKNNLTPSQSTNLSLYIQIIFGFGLNPGSFTDLTDFENKISIAQKEIDYRNGKGRPVGFNPRNSWHLAANYLRIHKSESRTDETRPLSIAEYNDLVKNRTLGARGTIPLEDQIQLKALAYEAIKLLEFILKLRNEGGRDVVVVANKSYGLMAVSPIRKALAQLGITVIETKIGSTDAHGDPTVIDFKNRSLFTPAEIQMFAENRPNVVVVDGSYSLDHNKVQQFRRHESRFPDAYQGYRNFFIALNEAWKSDEVAQPLEEFQKENSFLETLQGNNKFRTVVETARRHRSDNQTLYKMRFWTPAFGSKPVLAFSENHAIREDITPPIFDSEKDGTGPNVIMVQSAIENREHPFADREHPTISDEVREWIGGENISAYFDDTAHFKNFYHRFSEGEGVVKDLAYQNAAEEYFFDFLDRFKIHIPGVESVENVDNAKRLDGYVFDLTGTLAHYGKPIDAWVIERLEQILENKKKIAIITDDMGQEDMMARVVSQFKNRTALENLSIYYNGGRTLMKFDSQGVPYIVFDLQMNREEHSQLWSSIDQFFRTKNISAGIQSYEENQYGIHVNLNSYLRGQVNSDDARIKLADELQGYLTRSNIDVPAIYLLGKNNLALTPGHKPAATNDFVSRNDLQLENLLVAVNETGRRRNDREIVKQLTQSVRVNVGHRSSSLRKKNLPLVFQIKVKNEDPNKLERLPYLFDAITPAGNVRLDMLEARSEKPRNNRKTGNSDRPEELQMAAALGRHLMVIAARSRAAKNNLPFNLEEYLSRPFVKWATVGWAVFEASILGLTAWGITVPTRSPLVYSLTLIARIIVFGIFFVVDYRKARKAYGDVGSPEGHIRIALLYIVLPYLSSFTLFNTIPSIVYPAIAVLVQIISDARVAFRPVAKPDDEIAMQNAAQWLANLGVALQNGEVNEIMGTSFSLGNGSKFAKGNPDAAILSDLNRWIKRPEFQRMLVEKLKIGMEQTGKSALNKMDPEDLAELLTAIVLNKTAPNQIISPASDTHVFVVKGSTNQKERQRLRIGVIGELLTAGAQAQNVFVSDLSAREDITRAIKSLRAIGLDINLPSDSDFEKYDLKNFLSRDQLQLDMGNKFLENAPLVVAPKSMLPGNIPQNFRRLEEFIPLEEIDLNNLATFFRAALVAA